MATIKKAAPKRKAPVKKAPAKKTAAKKAPVRKTENNHFPTKNKPITGVKRPPGRYVKKGGNGGARPGAGRKPASTTRKTREVADKLAESGEMTPLEYMLEVMRETPDKIKAQYDKGQIDAVEYAVKMTELIKRRDNAAEKAAPYIHPRLASIEAKVDDSGHEKWLALMEGLAK